jgi:riboflavin synthase
MFTGIVEGTGTVVGVEETGEGRRLRIVAPFDADRLEDGQSIAINGACLTVEAFGEANGDLASPAADAIVTRDLDVDPEGNAWFEVFLATETVERTYLGEVGVGDAVNVERALAADDRLDGHFVQGHVDDTGEVLAIEAIGEDWEFTFSLPDSMAPYVVEKGSIAVDGISLTVADVAGDRFSVAIVPTTYEETTLSEKVPGDPVHLEVDVIAKYVESLLDHRTD